MLPRLFRRCLAAVVLAFSMSLPFAAGQPDASPPTIERGVKLDLNEGDSSFSSSPALPYFVLMLYTMLIMTIICMPSRKA